MPKDAYAVDVRAPCEEVFEIVHDYEHRLLWDSMPELFAPLLEWMMRARLHLEVRERLHCL